MASLAVSDECQTHSPAPQVKGQEARQDVGATQTTPVVNVRHNTSDAMEAVNQYHKDRQEWDGQTQGAEQ